ncbi:hypothetical protein BH11ACT3_BH11ACT3_19330 [soil metagenome]
MNPDDAIRVLTLLRQELEDGGIVGDAHAIDSWKARVRAVFVKALGEDNHLVAQLDGVWFSPGVYYEGQPESDFTDAQRSGARSAVAYIEAAIFDLGLSAPAPAADPLTPENFDAGLWAHVGSLVVREEWALLASAVATYVEDRVRTWSGLPAATVGHGLYANALGPNGALPLGGGGTHGEAEGWKYVGMGLAQAVGNVDRHRITSRSDLRRYAMGVLGLGSLLLTQLRWEHASEISNVEDR